VYAPAAFPHRRCHTGSLTDRSRRPVRCRYRGTATLTYWGMLSANFACEVIAMDDARAQLLRWIDEDRDEIVGFLCDFVRAKSPNPPGDTTLAAAHITRFLERNRLPFRIIAP